MPTVPIQGIDTSTLATEARYALDILQNLSIEQVNQLRQLMKLEESEAIDPPTLTALIERCKMIGIDLSEAAVNDFKTKHYLGNQGAYQGVIGPQTAEVYFDAICDAVAIANASQGLSAKQAPSGDLNALILAAANSLFDMSTTEGPDGGNNACAWSINRVLQKAGLPPLGESPNYVPSLLEALQNGRGKQIDRAEAKAGDLVVAFEEAHIGIGLEDGCTTVLSNSSSRGRFRWQSDTDFDGYYGGPSTIYRLV